MESGVILMFAFVCFHFFFSFFLLKLAWPLAPPPENLMGINERPILLGSLV